MLLGLHKNLSFNSGKIYPYATGGDYVYLYEEGNKTYRVHEFLSTGTSTLSVEVGGQMDVLVVGGGGGGARANTEGVGGGGGGAVATHTKKMESGTYSITVGGGGLGAVNGKGSNGGQSRFYKENYVDLKASGGGGGGPGCCSYRPFIDGATGGAGGGAGTQVTTAGVGGAAGENLNTEGEWHAYPGGNGGGNRAGGGGGGAGGTGQSVISNNTGDGGIGYQWYNGKYYAGGGGGAGNSYFGTKKYGIGGLGGGGDGATAAENGEPNTGGGGGGVFPNTFNLSANGGSGIVIVRYVVAEKKLWTPSELAGLQAWWDISDESTLFNATSGGSTPTNGEGTARLEDKSGNSRTLSQTTSSERPTKIENEVNGLSVLRFTNDRLDGSPFMYSLGNMTFAIVYKSSAAAQSFLVSEGRTTNNTPIYSPICSGGSSSIAQFFYRPDNGTVQVNYLQSYNWYSWNILTLMDSGSDIKYTGNGGAITSLTSSYTRSTTTLDLLRIGELARGTPDQFPNNADIGEIIVFDSVLSTADRQKLEGYLAHKWGLTNNLPAGHPYKYEPPYKVESEEIVTDGLVLNLDAGDYASYPRSGTTWYDISGNGLTGALTNGPTYDSANKGSIVFDGSDDYALVGNASSNQITTSLTLEAWVYPTQFDHTNISEVIAKWDNRQYKLAIAGTIFGVPYGYFYIDVSDTGSNDNYRRSSSTLTLNSWNHIVGVYTSGASPSLNVYLNGTLNNGNLVGSVPSSIYNGTSPVYIGSHGGRDFKGNIATARIYNRALSSTEISQNFNALRGRYGI